MFKDFSAQYLGNSELFSMMLVVVVILLIASIVYKKLPEKEKTIVSKKFLFRKVSCQDVFWMGLITLLYAVISLWNLGSFETIGSYWQPVSDHEEIIFELQEPEFDQILWVAGEGNNNTNPNGYQNQADFLIQGSHDFEVWNDVAELKDIDYLKIHSIEGSWNYRYVKLISRNSSNVLNEIGFKKANEDVLIDSSVALFSNPSSPYLPEALLDEQNFLVLDPSYMNETYFDEIYHTRNAQEIADGQYLYSYVHPLFGTQIISAGISMFGLSPFGWRIMGAVFGILMVPLMYLCALHLFHRRRSAVLAALLLSVECMHYTTSRIGTLEPFSIFFIQLMTYFMLNYCQTSFYTTPLKTQFIYLSASGIAMGCACATKFTGVYGGIGLAILFFSSLFQQTLSYRKSIINIKNQNFDEKDVLIAQKYWPCLVKTGLWCILFFVIVPLGIYVLSFVPVVMSKTQPFSIQAVYDQTMGMYNYHKNLEATHPYQSVWWQWILDIRPIWYYVKYNENTMQTISAMGNPIIFWTGAVAMIWCCIDAFKNKSYRALLISISYFAQVIPLLSVERCVFIYHYYPAIPFLILGIVHASESLLQKDKRYLKPIGWLAFAAVAVFVLFLPVIGGFETTSWYIQHIVRWMSSWYFG